MRRGPSLLLALLLGLASSSAAPRAEAQASKKPKVPRRTAAFHVNAGWATMTVSYRDVVDKKVEKKLKSGLPTTIITRAYLFRDGDPTPRILTAKSCRVVFDLWDEVFRIDRRQSGKQKRAVAVNVEGVLRRCAEASAWPIVSLEDLDDSGSYHVAVRAEVNPLSKKMLEQIKRWVSRPQGAGSVGPGDSLFGSFVGLFITQVPESDRAVAFRTQTFQPKKLPKLPKKEKEGARTRKRDGEG
ncbi:MAG: hypothetical protein R3B72_22765 [Polyangiaceae bacterium]